LCVAPAENRFYSGNSQPFFANQVPIDAEFNSEEFGTVRAKIG